MFRQSIVMSTLVDGQGEVIVQNPAAMSSFGARSAWVSWFVEPARVLRETLAGESRRSVLRTVLDDGRERWHVVETKPVRDPVTTEIVALIELIDVTEAERLEGIETHRSLARGLGGG